MKHVVGLITLITAVGALGYFWNRFGNPAMEAVLPTSPTKEERTIDEVQLPVDDEATATPTMTPMPTPSIDDLQQQFDNSTDKRTKQTVASILVTVLDNDSQYYDYLEGFAQVVVDSEIPYPLTNEGAVSPEFEAWCIAHNEEPEEIANEVLFQQPQDILFLAKTGDARAYSLFVEGLTSDNTTVVAGSTLGLAYINDFEAIPLIIEVAEGISEEAARWLVARSLLYFDDAAAQTAAEELIGDQEILDALQHQVELERVGP